MSRLTFFVTLAIGLLLLSIPASIGPLSSARWAASAGASRRMPEPPRSLVDTTLPSLSGRTIHVAAGGDLQGALNEARPGDRITLEPKAVYRGPFRLPAKQGDGWIVVTAAKAEQGLPPPGGRVNPSHAAAMPRLVAAAGSVLEADRGAHHYRFVGLEITPADGVFLNSLVQLGAGETDSGAAPHHIVFDRCYLHGDARRGTRRGIAMNSRHTAVVDSHLSDFKEAGADSQAIAGWNGEGPFKILNNYLEAAGENVMFGGADPAIESLVPADIEIRRNHFAKPLRWRIGDPSFEGTEWTVKNLFELKNARRVVVDQNLFEFNWPQGQNGFAILFTVRNQDGGAPWSTIEDVLFENNVVRHVAAGVNVLGRDDNHPSKRLARLELRNNLFLDVGGRWGGNGRLFQLLDGAGDVAIRHNTAFHSGSLLFGGDGAAHTGFVLENNIAFGTNAGITGSDSAPGLSALHRYFPASVVRGNVIIGGHAREFPPHNFFPATVEEVGFAAAARGQFRLGDKSPYLGAGAEGRSPGADLDPPADALRGGLHDAETVAGAGLLPYRSGPHGTGGDAAAFLVWLTLMLLAYVYVGYPVISWIRARLRGSPHRRVPAEPQVTILVAAHNEAPRIAAKIENLLALDYPPDRLDVVIGSDGSTDNTVDIACAYESDRLRVAPFRERRGKAALLNDLVPGARGDIVVLADARQSFDRTAIRALVAGFADADVGAVSGELMLCPDEHTAAAGHGAAFYWRYEKFIRCNESRVDSTIGATGAIYAIRRALFEPIPEDTILDDVAIPIGMVRRGYRVVFEPAARAYDRTSATATEEFARKTRTIAGMFQLFARERWLFNPAGNRLWFETFSHKALRLALPALHAMLLVANLALLSLWPYQWLFVAQLAFYGAAVLGSSGMLGHWRPRFISVPCAVCLLIWATLVGLFRFLTHRQEVTWERVAQSSACQPVSR
jgi:cellulose synthase/poly-beta-1,6-N-acetylglucosamine synthase-like glycosyltransferase